ncbi:MAG: hypothetical protein Q7S83_02125 [bacterium]|nr:hypothetical protein [bacterium]
MGQTLKTVLLFWLALMVSLVYFDVWYFDEIINFRPWYLDMVMHCLGGGFISVSFLYFAGQKYFGELSGRLLPFLILTLGVVALVAVGWEFYEYFVNILTGMPQEPASDTFSDLSLGLAGAAMTVVLIRHAKRG